jgi:hypothetical protein
VYERQPGGAVLLVPRDASGTTVLITVDPHWHAIPAMQEEAAALIAHLVFAQP